MEKEILNNRIFKKYSPDENKLKTEKYEKI